MWLDLVVGKVLVEECDFKGQGEPLLFGKEDQISFVMRMMGGGSGAGVRPRFH